MNRKRHSISSSLLAFYESKHLLQSFIPRAAAGRPAGITPPAQRLILFVCLLFGGAAYAQPDRADSLDQEARQRSDLEQLRTQVRDLRASLDRAQDRYGRLQRELRDVDERIGMLSKRVRELNRALSGRTKRLREQEAERRGLVRELDVHRQELARQIRSAYATGRQEYMKMLLNQQDPALVGRVLAYYDYLNRARSRRIGVIRDHVQRIDRLTETIRTEREALEQNRADLQAQRNALLENRAGRRKVIAQLKVEIGSGRKRLDQFRADMQRLEKLLSGIRDSVRPLTDVPVGVDPFATLKGRLPWPARGRLLAHYGKSRRVGRLKWQGVLIGAREGSEVHAVSHGRVVFADWLRGFGLLIIIDHGAGYMSLYGHNQSLSKQTGDWVEAGEPVATIGRSGGHSQTGLYFEIRHNGRPRNPMKWLVIARNP